MPPAEAANVHWEPADAERGHGPFGLSEEQWFPRAGPLIHYRRADRKLRPAVVSDPFTGELASAEDNAGTNTDSANAAFIEHLDDADLHRRMAEHSQEGVLATRFVILREMKTMYPNLKENVATVANGNCARHALAIMFGIPRGMGKPQAGKTVTTWQKAKPGVLLEFALLTLFFEELVKYKTGGHGGSVLGGTEDKELKDTVMNEFKTMTEANMIVKGDIQYLPADAHGDGIVFKAAACHMKEDVLMLFSPVGPTHVIGMWFSKQWEDCCYAGEEIKRKPSSPSRRQEPHDATDDDFLTNEKYQGHEGIDHLGLMHDFFVAGGKWVVLHEREVNDQPGHFRVFRFKHSWEAARTTTAIPRLRPLRTNADGSPINRSKDKELKVIESVRNDAVLEMGKPPQARRG